MSNAQVTSLFTARETMTRTMKNIETSATRLDRAFGSMRGRMRAAFEFNVVNRGMDLFWRGVNNIVDALPDMIHRGERWAETIDAITDATGLSAQQASELAAVNQRVGGSNDSLTRGFAALAKSVYTSRDAWKTMGVAVALNRDGSVDAYRTFQNLRRAISDTGGSLLSTAAAQTALGRGGKDLLDLLQLTDRQYRLLAQDARASGQIMTAEALAAAENWSRAQARIGGVLDGLGTQLLGRLAPLLTRFADGFASFIQRNMDNIIRLVVGAANTVLTVIGDLLGIDLGQWSFTEEVSHAADETLNLGKGLKDVAKAHDKASTATSGHASAVDALRKAERELARAQASGVGFTGDKSRYEQERARQARLAAIADAQQRVKDARKALADTASGAEAAGAAAGAAYWKGFGRAGGGKKGGKGGNVPDLFGGLGQVIKDSTQTGHDIADAIKDAIFGEDTLATVFGGSGSPKTFEVRSGGLLDKIGQLVTSLGNLARLVNVGSPLVLALGALAIGSKVAGLASSGQMFMSNFGWQGMLGMGAGGAAGLIGQEVINQQDRRSGFSFDLFKQINGILGRDYTSDLNRADAKHPGKGTLEWLLDFNDTLEWWTDLLKPASGAKSFPNPNQNPALFPPPGGWPSAAAYSGWRTDGPDSPGWVPKADGSGFDFQGFGLSDPFGITLASVFRTWMGESSPVALGLSDLRQGLYGVQSAVETGSPTDPGGGSGNTGLVGRVDTLERQMTGVADSSLKTANQRQDKALRGLTNVNAAQGRAIQDRVTIKNYNTGYRRNAQQHRAMGNSIDDHERRLDRLDGGGGTNPDNRATARHTQRTASTSEQMLNVLRDIRGELRGGRRHGTSSLRANP